MSGKLLTSLAIALTMASATSGRAQATPPLTGFVRDHALALLEGALRPDQITTLQLIAYQSAIANVCEGLNLDETRFTQAFATLAPVDAARMTEAQRSYHDSHLLVVFGVLVGGELSAVAADPTAACDQAMALKSDPEMASVLVWE